MALRRDILVYDYLFVVGPYQMRMFHESQLVRQGDRRLIPIGFPKTDRLVNGSLNRRSILKRVGFSGRRPILIYAPTGQRRNSLEMVGEEVIRRLKEKNEYDLLIKLHDHPRDQSVNWGERLRKHEDRHTKIIREYDVIPYLYASDLLITDASSVSAEFTLLDRPVVFIDVPELIEAVKSKGVPVDLDTWGRKGGVTARWPDEVIDAVRWSLRHPRHASAVRRAMADDMFFNPGAATDAAARWILTWFGREGS